MTNEFKVSPPEIMVLKVLNKKGNLAAFEIKKNADLKTVRIYSIINSLVSKKMVELVGIERRNKMGRPNSIYSITDHGIDLLDVVKNSE